MTAAERDEVVAQALRDLPVPPHRPTFWSDLEGQLADGAPKAAAGDDRPPTGELPAVAPLEARRRNRRTPLLAAAAVVVLLAAVGFVALGGDGDDDDTEVANEPSATERSTDQPANDASEPAVTTVSAPTEAATTEPTGNDGSPEDVVVSWLDALGAGDVQAAAALTGPRSAAYVESLGPDATLEGFLTESQEGFGAWSGADDREVTLLPLEPIPFDGGTLQVVVVSGTYPGEGGPGTRVDVFPVVDDGEGFKVEHLAFDPARDNDITFTLPEETDEGLGSMAPTEDINVFVPAQGTAYLQIDGAEVLTDTTSEVAGRPFALFHPRGDLTPGEHLLVLVAVGDDGTVAAFGGSFTVEG